MSDRTPEPVDRPVEMSWPEHRTADAAEIAAATRAAAARARAEALLAADPDDVGSRRTPTDTPAMPPTTVAPDAAPTTVAAAVPAADSPAASVEAPPEGQISGARRMVSAAAIMMAGTIVSRILGLARVVLAAYLLGNNSRQAEIWSLATTVPNSLYILLAGGALNTVLVPQIVRAVKDDADGGEAYTNRIMTAFLLLVAVMAVILVVAAPGIAWLYSDSAWHAPALAPQFASMALLTALCMPQVFFYGAFFLIGQVLNARETFGPMMWAPIANNIVSVLVLSLYAAIWGFHSDTSQPFTTSQALLLGIGSVVGIAMQTAVLIPFLRKVGFRYRPRFDFRHTGLGHTFHVAKWTLGFVAVNQVALLIVTRLGTSATARGTGAGMAAYYNANLLWVLPHSLITVSLATAILPSMSRLAAAGQPGAVGRELTRAIRLTTTALVPVSLLYATLGVPIATLAFRGATKGGDLVGWTLVAFAIGLIPFTVQYLILRAFYAFEDTRATFLIQIVIASLNALLALLFVGFVNPGPNWVAPALALAYTLAYVVGLALSTRWLRVHVPTFRVREIGVHTLTVAGAALPAALVAYALVYAQKRWSTTLPADLLGMVGALLLAGLVYLAMTRVLGVAEVGQVIDLVRRRGRRKEADVADQAEETPTTSPGPAAPALSAPTTVLPAVDGAAAGAVVGPDSDPGATTGDVREVEPAVVPDIAATADTTADSDADADPGRATHLPVGHVLGGRFRLDEELAVRGSTVTWKATDLRLSRTVLIHVLSADDPDTPAVVEAAKQSAQTMDARFLKVFDAVDEPIPAAAELEGHISEQNADHDADTTVGEAAEPDPPYIVCEWAAGLNLTQVLAGGPLPALESAWLVQQLADALTLTHAQGMYHQRLNLDTVVITNTGHVKTVGFLIEAALHDVSASAAGDPPVRPERQEADDVLALGRILYATLVARWPGAAQYGLPAAPITLTGAWQTPAQVRAGVSPPLDRIADRILNPEPRSGEPIRTAAQIAQELNAILGPVDASSGLAHRVRYLMENPAGSGLDEPTPPAGVTPLESHVERVAGAPDLVSTPVPPPPAPAQPETSRRVPWVLVLAGLVVLGLVASVIGVALTRSKDTAGGSPSAAASAGSVTPSQSGPYKIAAGKDFDPEADKGNGTENPEQVPYAFDGKPDTAWTTLTYLGNAKLGNLKPGVGLVLDLGKPVPVSAVQLALTGNGTNVELRVPTKDPATITAAPMTSAKEWTVVASANGAGASVQLTPKEKVTTRFLLVYFTQLPPVSSGKFQAGIAEVSVLP